MSFSSETFAGVLLAAGRGTRLRPLTDVIPKPALPLLDVPLGAYGLALLERLKGPRVANVSHLGDVARTVLEDTDPALAILDEGPEPLGTGGTLDALRDRLAGTFVTVNADLVSDLDLGRLLRVHRASGARATVAVATAGSAGDRTADLVGQDGRITGFVDRRKGTGATGLGYLGVAAFEREVLDLVPRGRVSGLADTVLEPLARSGEMAYMLHEGYAIDVGTPERYLRASLDLLAGRGPRSPTPPGRIIEVPGGHAYVGPGARIGAADLGDGAVVSAGARVEGRVQRSVVMPGAVVPAGADLDRAICFSTQVIPVAAT